MQDEKQYITEEKKKALEVEIIDLQTVKRKEILDSIEFAKSLGDLSENAEYHQAREAQAKLEDRIMTIEYILKNSVIVSKHSSSQVEVGSSIIVMKDGEKDKKTFEIVGSEEADMSQGKISNLSPLGRALIGKKKGEVATFQSPGGEIKYKIMDIE